MKQYKKLFIVLFSLVLCFNATSGVFAADGPSENEGWQEKDNEPEVRYHDYYAIGANENISPHPSTQRRPKNVLRRWSRAFVTESAWTSYGIERYYQDDYTNSICAGGGTVASYGCALTSFSMVLSKYEVYRNPEEVFYDLLASGGIKTNCDMVWSAKAINSAYSGIIMEHWSNAANGYKEKIAMTTIEGVLRTGKPVIVGMKKVSDSNSEHYVVVYGYEKYSDGGVFHYIFNPQRNRPETLEGYMDEWYIRNFTTLYRNY